MISTEHFRLWLWCGDQASSGLDRLDSPWPDIQHRRRAHARSAVLCQANREAVLELTADGSLILMPPTGGGTGVRNGALLGWLLIPAERTAEVW